MGKRGVTISDIADRIGVSKVTVSYVLNGRETGIRISDETRRRVLKVAKEMGYHPNALARGLARRCTDTLTLVMQSPSVFSGGSGFMNELMRGVLDRVNELGYDLMLHTKELPDVEREVQALTDGRADGALLLRDVDDPLAPRLAERGFPCVHIFSRSICPGVWYVDCDNIAGGRMATEYLLHLGHVRIGHLGGSPHSAAAVDRLEGYRQALRAHGIEPDPAWHWTVTYAGGDFGPFLAAMARADAPTAVFAWSDDVAIRAMRLLRENLGRRVPEEVSVIGYDSTEVCENVVPRLSSVRQPIYEMAARGVEMLVAQIRKQTVTAEERHLLFEPKLVCRQTCGRPQEEQ